MKKILSIFLVLVMTFMIFTVNVSANTINIKQEKSVGWSQVDGKWYYVKEDGSLQTEWLNLNGIWYYFNEDGVMQTGWIEVDGLKYYINKYGAMQTGWLELDGKKYYLNPYGAMVTGWLELENAKYYFNEDGVMAVGWIIIQDKKYLFDSEGKCVEGAHRFVIDISKWQGNIDWEKLSKTDIDGVILRSSYGGETTENNGDCTDTKFVEYIENLNRLKIPYGTYHYNTATTVELAKIQAQNVVNILKETGAKPTYPVFVDIEEDGGECDLIAIAKVYIEVFIENGYKPGIYANQNYWEKYLAEPEFNAYYRWIANYGINKGLPNSAFKPKDDIKNYMMWQYTSEGKIDGIKENVDFNALFDWYEKPDGWQEVGNKKYYYSDGYLKYGWFMENNKWYYLKPTGEMATGWLYVNNTWYYLDKNGVMQTEWLNLNNNWYYLGKGGAMHKGWLKLGSNWYYLNENGTMKTGWLRLGNDWYYLNSYGIMQTGWLNLNGFWYYLNQGGSMKTGWLKLGNVWYYLNDNGVMHTGWLRLNNNWYYLNSNGAMQTGWIYVSNTWYYLNEGGVWVK